MSRKEDALKLSTLIRAQLFQTQPIHTIMIMTMIMTMTMDIATTMDIVMTTEKVMCTPIVIPKGLKKMPTQLRMRINHMSNTAQM